MPASATRTGPRTIALVGPTGADGGGMGRVADNLITALADAPVEVVSLVTRDDRGKWASLRLLACTMFKLAELRVRGDLLLVHINMGDAGSFVRKSIIALFSRLLGTPTFIHLHAVSLERQLVGAGALKRRLVALPFEVATCVIVLGDNYRQWLERKLGAHARVEVVRNGVDIGDAVAQPRPVGSEPKSILFLGTLGERKGVTDLLRALSVLEPGTPAWRLTLVGGGEMDRYRRLAADLSIDDRLTFSGWLSQMQVREALASADLLVLPSYEEGMPLAIIEAMGLGVPVIATPVGSIPEVLRAGEDVLFVQPGDVLGLATVVSRALTDDALRAGLAEKAKTTFDEHFSLQAFRSRVVTVWTKYVTTTSLT